MPRKPCEQLNRSLLQVCATSWLALGMMVCSVSTAYSFSVGPLPGLNCPLGSFSVVCDLAKVFAQYQEVHQIITDQALKGISFTPPSGGSPVVFAPDPLGEIRDANAHTDYTQGAHQLHFDNAYLTMGGKRLIEGKKELLKQLRQPSTLTATEIRGLRILLGRYLHTLQDFYAHSNYVNLASPLPIQLGDDVLFPQPSSPFPCNTTLGDTTLSAAGVRNLLTTGYAQTPLAAALAPFGQCAHGLLKNGIHKDWEGRNDHDRARGDAIAASKQFVNSIITDSSITNKDNVCMFMSDKPCQKSTFTCPDNKPNISAIATISGYHGGDSKGADGPGPVQVSVSNDLGSATAGGEKGSASVTFNARMVNREGNGGRASVNYKDSFRITSSSKALGSQGTAILSAVGSASSSGTCQSDSMNGSDPVSTSASATITDSLSFSIGYEARFNCPDTIPAPPTPTSAMLNFGYGQIMSFSVTAVAAGQILGPPWGPSSSGSTTGSANISYNVSVQGDPDAVVTWCRAPAQ